MANTSGEKELKTDWPVVTGIEAIDKHEGRKPNLEAETDLLEDKEKVGL